MKPSRLALTVFLLFVLLVPNRASARQTTTTIPTTRRRRKSSARRNMAEMRPGRWPQNSSSIWKASMVTRCAAEQAATRAKGKSEEHE